jgi:hypothetical protein
MCSSVFEAGSRVVNTISGHPFWIEAGDVGLGLEFVGSDQYAFVFIHHADQFASIGQKARFAM